MAEASEKSLQDLAAKVGVYPEDAYHFVREGLSFAVHRVHGPETPAQAAVMRYLARNSLTLEDLATLYQERALSASVLEAIEEAGGVEALNRHVSGGELCWGLRDYAQYRWGIMARRVLEAWNVRATEDFGRLVFAMIDYEFMQKQPSDTLEDFKNVFDFAEAFDDSYEVPTNRL